MPGLFRKAVKPSKSIFSISVLLSIGLTIEFFRGVWLDVHINQRQVNVLTLPFYWLLWNLLPITFFALSWALKRQGR